jgi:hypothetical protein
VSRERAVNYVNRAIEILSQGGISLADKAIILTGLAQVEATLEVADQIENGLQLGDPAKDIIEEHSAALLIMAKRLEDQ